MAAEIQIIEQNTEVEVRDENSAVVRVFNANMSAAQALESAEQALEQVQEALEEVDANHVEIIFNTTTNELYALWGVN